jgi:regulator of nucleoside diphosphate kinase
MNLFGKKEKNPVLMTREDYRIIKRFLPYAPKDNRGSLAQELKRAIILNKFAFPRHAIRLNSAVSVLEVKSNRVLNFTIVAPGLANAAKKKLSVLTRLATALIGFCKGQEVCWPMPGGMKTFKILDVVNAA